VFAAAEAMASPERLEGAKPKHQERHHQLDLIELCSENIFWLSKDSRNVHNAESDTPDTRTANFEYRLSTKP
jgi:hypothetical protein